ncbi:hypothetical protein UFOVP347_29 [uncultured Caudovirales phage]|uniref:Uncharacterized protein n=1 Tax=uncultured Caudovirales phage TaxID=2100421 RepID=A0A6J5M384_9CAUD|nr:hypothetical protein UFOVP347_29 [uncultured Caudovirales phage]
MRYKLMLTLLVLILLIFVPACSDTAATASDPCAWVRPLSWHERDTPGTLRAIFSHNLKVEQFCQQGR